MEGISGPARLRVVVADCVEKLRGLLTPARLSGPLADDAVLFSFLRAAKQQQSTSTEQAHLSANLKPVEVERKRHQYVDDNSESVVTSSGSQQRRASLSKSHHWDTRRDSWKKRKLKRRHERQYKSGILDAVRFRVDHSSACSSPSLDRSLSRSISHSPYRRRRRERLTTERKRPWRSDSSSDGSGAISCRREGSRKRSSSGEIASATVVSDVLDFSHSLCSRLSCVSQMSDINIGFSDAALAFTWNCYQPNRHGRQALESVAFESDESAHRQRSCLREATPPVKGSADCCRSCLLGGVIVDRIDCEGACSREFFPGKDSSNRFETESSSETFTPDDGVTFSSAAAVLPLTDLLQYILPGVRVRATVISYFRPLHSLIVSITAIEIPPELSMSSSSPLERESIRERHDRRERTCSFSERGQTFQKNVRAYDKHYNSIGPVPGRSSKRRRDSRDQFSECNDPSGGLRIVDSSTDISLYQEDDKSSYTPERLLGLLRLQDVDERTAVTLPSSELMCIPRPEGGVFMCPKTGVRIRAIVPTHSKTASIVRSLGQTWMRIRCISPYSESHHMISADDWGNEVLKLLKVKTVLSMLISKGDVQFRSKSFKGPLVSGCLWCTWPGVLMHLIVKIQGAETSRIRISDVTCVLGLFPTTCKKFDAVRFPGLLAAITSDPKFINPTSARLKFAMLNLMLPAFHIPSLLPLLPLDNNVGKATVPNTGDTTLTPAPGLTALSISLECLDIALCWCNLQKEENRCDISTRFPYYPLYRSLGLVWARDFVKMGICLAHSGKWSAAVEHYNFALLHCPDCVDALVARGAAYANRNMFTEAIADFDEALKLEPRNGNAILYRKKTIGRSLITAIDRSESSTTQALDGRIAQKDFCLNWKDERARLKRYGKQG